MMKLLQENLRAVQARDKAIAQREKDIEAAQQSAITERGGNPAEEMLKQKKLADFEKEKQ